MPTTEITCRCKTCKTNAANLGVPFPLRATAPSALVGTVKTMHGLVYMAYEPGALGERLRAQTGVKPA